MERLRTVVVLEHEFVPVLENGKRSDAMDQAAAWFTELEAQALLELNAYRRGFCQQVVGGIKFAQYCGIFRLPNCVVEVLPKVGMVDARSTGELERARAALLAMLHSARRLVIKEVGVAPQRVVRAPLLDVFIRAFLQCALAQARRGLLSQYVTHADDLPVVKGRFHAHGHIRRNLSRPHTMHCEYDELTADNAYNRSVRATLDACQNWISDTSTQRLWFETHTRYAGVTSRRMSAHDVASLPRNRITHRYQVLLTWCEWLLSMASPSQSAGATSAPGLLFDMNKLFEEHVSELERNAVGTNRIVLTQGPRVFLVGSDKHGCFSLKPDITVWHLGKDGSASTVDRIVDAKWKRVDPSKDHLGVDEADIYQLLVYGMRYGCRSLELAYPMPSTGPAVAHYSTRVLDINCGELIEGEPLRVYLRLIPLWESPTSPFDDGAAVNSAAHTDRTLV